MSDSSQRSEIDQAGSSVHRPVIVWIICTFYGLGIILMIWNNIAFYSGSLPIDSDSLEAIKHRTGIDVLFEGFRIVAYSAAVVALFRLRREALALFLFVFILNVLHLAYYRLGHPGFLQYLGKYWWVQSVSFVPSALVAAYAYYLWKTGRLKA